MPNGSVWTYKRRRTGKKKGSRLVEDEVLSNCEEALLSWREDRRTLQSLGIRRFCCVGSPSASGRGSLFCCCFEVVDLGAEVVIRREFAVSAPWTTRVLPAKTLLFCDILLLWVREWDPCWDPCRRAGCK
jgi:hypothetical protein